MVKMANEIGAFFAGESKPEQAPRDVANHLKRYWDPRMRAQMLKYYEERQGAGLTDLGKSAVALLHAERQAATGSPAAPAQPAAPAKGAGT